MPIAHGGLAAEKAVTAADYRRLLVLIELTGPAPRRCRCQYLYLIHRTILLFERPLCWCDECRKKDVRKGDIVCQAVCQQDLRDQHSHSQGGS